MSKYEICNSISGYSFGVYEADSEADALDVISRDAGYKDWADVCSVALMADGEIVVRLVNEITAINA